MGEAIIIGAVLLFAFALAIGMVFASKRYALDAEQDRRRRIHAATLGLASSSYRFSSKAAGPTTPATFDDRQMLALPLSDPFMGVGLHETTFITPTASVVAPDPSCSDPVAVDAPSCNAPIE